MILNTVTLHNFMSYGDAIVDMTSFSIACMSGFNGAGKSAILDAVTWAIWESARSSSDELIRAGESEMWVDVVFELEGSLYRIRRARQRSAPRGGTRAVSKGSLEFQVSRHSANGNGHAEWSSLTCATMKETQSRICEVLRMDYDTFINSVYLRQGRADEFTTRPPSERKQVLAEILGLSYFDRLQERAKEQARQRRAQIDVLEASLAEREVVASSLSLARAQKTETDRLYNEIAASLQKQESELSALSDELADLATIATQVQPTQARLEELQQDAASLEATATKLRARLAEIDALLSTVDDAENVTKRFAELKAEVERLDEISLSRQDLETRRLELKGTIANARGRTEVEMEHQQVDLARLKELREKLTTQVAQKDKLSAEYEKYHQLVKQEAAMAQKQEAHVQLQARAEQLHTQIVEMRFHLEAEVEQKQRALEDLDELLRSGENLSETEERLRLEQENLERCEVEFETVEEQGLKLKHDIDGIDLQIAQIRQQQAENDHKCSELQEAKTLTMCPLCAGPIVDRAAVLARYQDMRSSLDHEIDQLANRKALLEEQRQQLRTRYVELKRSLNTRKQLDRQVGEFNARKLALQRADQNRERLMKEVAELQTRLQNQQYCEVERESLINLKAEMHKLEFDPVVYAGLQAQIRALRHLDVRYQQYKRDEAELARVDAQIPQLENSIRELSLLLQTDQFAPDARAEIAELEAKLAEVPYDRAHHQQRKQQLAKLLPLVERLRDVERALAQRPLLTQELEECETRLQQRTEQSLQLESSVRVWSTRLQRVPELESRKRQLEQARAGTADNVADLQRQQIVLSTQIDQLEQQEAAFEARRQQLDILIEEMNDYAFLAEALGKKGIQAVIIENAVPEIEAESNRLLSRLSDNQMHVALVTQQKTKQGNIAETLDIVIADAMGTRNYELYSGGEAFKINFAVRLALSRLLARRAGAKLQSLIIDEGFGSQDEESRLRLVKAINAIRGDFARILVVTHIAEVKELFPVQLHVEKRNGVSSVNLVHGY